MTSGCHGDHSSGSNAETVVVTPNGQTVVIGGLMETQRVESVRKVPILGDIPLIGLAFKRTIKDDVKRELLIFLTPHIVSTAACGWLGARQARAGPMLVETATCSRRWTGTRKT